MLLVVSLLMREFHVVIHAIDSPSMYPPVKQNWFQLEITNSVSTAASSCRSLHPILTSRSDRE